MSELGVTWATASRTLGGGVDCGDRYIVRPRRDGALIAAVDGLGHGPEAARAAERAIGVLSEHTSETLLSLTRRCHDALVGTRGVVMSLARIDVFEGIVAWMGVGNVEGVIVRRDGNGGGVSRESLVSRPGVIGNRLPPLIATLLPISEGDTLIFATDGVDANFERSIVRYDPPEAIANRILANHAKGTDDALVLVARYVGR